MQRAADRAQQFGLGHADTSVVTDRGGHRFDHRLFGQRVERIQRFPHRIQRQHAIARWRIRQVVARQHSLQAGQVGVLRGGAILVPGLRDHREQGGEFVAHIAGLASPETRIAGRIQRLADLHGQQAPQAVFEQRHLAIGMDHRVHGIHEGVELRTRTQAQHRERERRQRQAQHRMQVGGELLVDAHGVIGDVATQARGNVRMLAFGKRFVFAQEQAKQQRHHRFALAGKVVQGLGNRDDDAVGAAVIIRRGRGHLRGHHRWRHAQFLCRARQSRTAATGQAKRHVFLHAVRRRRDPLRLQACQRFIVEARFQRADPLQQWRMGGEQLACEELVEAHAIAEQHVADFLGIAALVEARAIVQATDLLQRTGQSLRLPGELHCAGIGQFLARPAHPGLDHPPEEQADVADEHRHQRGHQDRADALAAPAESPVLQDLAADQADHQDAEQHADQADVQPHVAVEDVAELVGDDALQLVAIEPVQRAAGHRDHGVGSRVAGGEGIDAGFVFQHVELGHRHAGGDRDFLDHVAQATQSRLGGVLRDQGAAQLLRHRFTATAQAGDAVERADRDHRDRRQGGEQHQLRRLRGDPDHAIDRQHDAGDRQRHQEYQPRRRPPRCGLLFEEIHGGDCEFTRAANTRLTSCSAGQNDTFGAARVSASLSAGIASRFAAAKLNMPAKMLDGNTSRLLL